MRVEDYEKYMTVVRDLAYLENDLRLVVHGYPGQEETDYVAGGHGIAQRILFEHFGVSV